jgi:3-deoxy-D-manno-octulosonic-acid transferase
MATLPPYPQPDFLLYRLGVKLYFFLARIAAFGGGKYRSFVDGREESRLQLSRFSKPDRPLIWFHCSSLGEFEQARPLIEQIRTEQPGKHFIALSFFSPSGYEPRKNYSAADLIFYLPEDSPGKAGELLDQLNPSAVFWIKYDFWLCILQEIRKREVPLYLIASRFRPEQIFFKPLAGRLFRAGLKNFSFIFEQTEEGVALLERAGITNSRQTFDTRFDRVLMNAASYFPAEEFQQFISGNKLLIAGSSWPADEDFLIRALQKGEFADLKLIIAPHQVDEERIRRLMERLPQGSLRYSEISSSTHAVSARVLVIDKIGMLAGLYRLADFAYVGGGFNHAVHNVLEPVVFGIPVVFGPRFSRSAEAIELMQCGAAFSFRDQDEFHGILRELIQKEASGFRFEMAAGYVQTHSGGTRDILQRIRLDLDL